MSRIGKKPISVPSGVKVKQSGASLSVEGPKGMLCFELRPEVQVRFDDEKRALEVLRLGDQRVHRAMHGTTRAILANMVEGVSRGFERRLEIVGVGYNAKLQERNLLVSVGFRDPVSMEVPEGLDVEVPSPTVVVVRGADKQKVGQFAATVRRIRPPEPYKGKGIRYEGEVIIRKAGKTFGGTE